MPGDWPSMEGRMPGTDQPGSMPTRPRRLRVRTPDFQSGKEGSTPSGATRGWSSPLETLYLND